MKATPPATPLSRSNPLRGSGLPVPSRRTFATGILPCAHSTQARFGILPLARLRGRLDDTGNPSLPHTSPGREPGDCGVVGPSRLPCLPCHPGSTTSLEPGSCPIGAPRHSPPARAGGFYAAHAMPKTIAILPRALARIQAPGASPGTADPYKPRARARGLREQMPPRSRPPLPSTTAHQGSSIRSTICFAIRRIDSCWVLATDRPNSGTSVADWPTSTVAAGSGTSPDAITVPPRSAQLTST